MYSILFHLLWLSLLEIIFYFEYIGPLETNTYKNTIKRLSKSNNNNYIVNPYNTSDIIDINNIEPNINNAKKDRINFNNHLYLCAIHYWLYFFGVVIFIYIFIILYKYRTFLKQKKNNDDIEIEFTTVRNRTITDELVDIDLSDNNEELTNENNNSLRITSFIDYNKLKKIIIEKSVFYISLGALIILFEYLFFNYIIMKYQVLSDEEILNEIYKIINPLLENIFIS